MGDLVKIDMQDLKKMIGDEVRETTAKTMTESLEKALESAERAKVEGDPMRHLRKVLGETDVPGAAVDRATLRVTNDPFKGKGLAFARAIKVAYLAKATGQSERDAAHAMSKVEGGHRGYADLADFLDDAKKRAMAESVFTSGGALLQPQLAADFIELLYAAVIAQSLGATTMDFNRAMDFGKMNTGASISYVGEGQSVVPTAPGFGRLALSAKKAMAVVPFSNELLRNPSIGADTIIRDDLLRAMALRRDLSFFRGAGDTFQPKGINKWINSANVFPSTGTTLAAKVADIIKMVRLVDESNVPLASGGFAMAPRSKWGLAATLDGLGQFVFAAMIAAGNVFGFKLGSTTQIPTNLGGGTNESEVYYGAFADAIIGMDIGTPLTIETFLNGTYNDGTNVQSGVSNDQSVIRAIEGHDMLLRHDKSFAQLTTVTWS
jgi:HK97 family phage major capsid protein